MRPADRVQVWGRTLRPRVTTWCSRFCRYVRCGTMGLRTTLWTLFPAELFAESALTT